MTILTIDTDLKKLEDKINRYAKSIADLDRTNPEPIEQDALDRAISNMEAVRKELKEMRAVVVKEVAHEETEKKAGDAFIDRIEILKKTLSSTQDLIDQDQKKRKDVDSAATWKSRRETLAGVPGRVAGSVRAAGSAIADTFNEQTTSIGLSQGWRSVAKIVNACCSAIANAFFTVKDNLLAFNESRKAMNGALKAAAEARDATYEDITNFHYNNFAEKAERLGADVTREPKKGELDKQVVTDIKFPGAYAKKSFMETVKAFCSNPSAFFDEVTEVRLRQKKLDAAYQQYKADAAHDKHIVADRTYKTAVGEAKGVGEAAATTYKQKMQAERNAGKTIENNNEPAVDDGQPKTFRNS